MIGANGLGLKGLVSRLEPAPASQDVPGGYFQALTKNFRQLGTLGSYNGGLQLAAHQECSQVVDTDFRSS